MKRVAAMLALLSLGLATPAFARPSKSHRARGGQSVKRQDLGLATTMLFFPFLLPLPMKSRRIAHLDVNLETHRSVDKGSAIQGKPVVVR